MRFMTKAKAIADPLAGYLKTTGKSDAAIGRLIGASRWKISRGRRGDPPFSIEDQMALQEFTGVRPAQWAEYYAKLITARDGAQKKSVAEAVA